MYSPPSPLRSPRKTTSDYTLDISVVGASKELNGDLHIHADTNIPSYSRTRYSITRTHAEMERLASYVRDRYPEVMCPVVPSKGLEMAVYARLAEQFLRRLVATGEVRESDGVRLFFESEFQFVPPTEKTPLSRKRTSAFSLFTAAPRVQDVDPFFDNVRSEALAIEKAFAEATRSVDKMFRVEKAMAVSYLDTSTRLNGLANEELEVISSGLKKVGKAFQMIEVLCSNQAAYTTNVFMEYCTFHTKSAQAALVSLDHRSFILNDYDVSCKTTQKKIQGIERLKSASSIKQEKVDAALHDLEEAKKVENENRDLLKKLGDVVKEECIQYQTRHEEDLLANVNEYVAKQLHLNSQMLVILTSV